jgi:hypothetical protein
LKIITSRRQSDIGFPGSAGSPEKRWPLAGYDARIAGFSYAEPRFKASGHWILRQDRGFSTRDEPLPPAQPAAISSPANLPSAIEAAPSASGSVRQALLDLYKSSEKLSRSYST